MGNIAHETRWLDATAQAELVRNKEVTASELAEAAITRIEQLNPAINAVNIPWFAHGRELAKHIDATSSNTAFAGVPFLLKDLHTMYAGQHISQGNKALKEANYIATSDTTLVTRFKEQQLVFLGRTSSPEFGSLPVTEPEAWGATRNPWNTNFTPGGSSGGAAAAVASGMVPIAHASDGGGSIRVPASCSGLVGLKVSQGRISVGPTRLETNLGVELAVSRSVRDIAALLDAVHGAGIGDTVIAPPPLRPYVDELTANPGKLRIGFVQSHFNGNAIHPECVTAVTNAAQLLESLGHHVELAFPTAINDPKAGGRFMTLWSTNMATSRQSISDMLGREVTNNDVELVNWVMAEYSSKVSALDYALAINDNGVYRRAVQQWWEDGWDILLTPTLAAPPLAIGVSANNPNDPMSPLKVAGEWMGFTAQFNTTGQPAISLPLHMSDDGLPVGVQLVGAYGREDILIRLAAQIETAAPWAHLTPSI